jgi:hypothetical protein
MALPPFRVWVRPSRGLAAAFLAGLPAAAAGEVAAGLVAVVTVTFLAGEAAAAYADPGAGLVPGLAAAAPAAFVGDVPAG